MHLRCHLSKYILVQMGVSYLGSSMRKTLTAQNAKPWRLEGLGVSINYRPPPMVPWPPPPLPQIGFPSIFPPHGATGTPVSMNLFTWLRIHIQILRYFMSIYHVLYLEEHLNPLSGWLINDICFNKND